MTNQNAPLIPFSLKDALGMYSHYLQNQVRDKLMVKQKAFSLPDKKDRRILTHI